MIFPQSRMCPTALTVESDRPGRIHIHKYGIIEAHARLIQSADDAVVFIKETQLLSRLACNIEADDNFALMKSLDRLLSEPGPDEKIALRFKTNNLQRVRTASRLQGRDIKLWRYRLNTRKALDIRQNIARHIEVIWFSPQQGSSDLAIISRRHQNNICPQAINRTVHAPRHTLQQ